MFLTSSDASILVYKFRPERTGFNMYVEYTQPKLTFLAFVPFALHSTFISDDIKFCSNTFLKKLLKKD